ncbi:MAG: hypothetical protein UW86_C0003G0001 [Microgenomates group bacterium GW2011_GWA1_Microgenomates_45_10]|nr:MAG: hypothetical protein UW69_C0027G0001 [Microgenomates group bacterium GW2011_GWA2_44_7]KKT77633.1 MAG: hypothetical protein UW73_C0015G0001 [Microgenomates group bacterium GW2011_GWB1_44_8]KKT87356.1 MAG: hypothetical protein UW86_C0003G0001 [Microgenomates group bacterium GW2011_GWA1_Microgenomates_45_10]
MSGRCAIVVDGVYRRGFANAVLIIVVIVVIGAIGYLAVERRVHQAGPSLVNNSPPLASRQPPKLGSGEPTGLSGSYSLDDFYLLVGGILKRSSTGYSLEPSLTSAVPDASMVSGLRGETEKRKEISNSIYTVEVVSTDGKREVLPTTLMVEPAPGDDVVRSLVSEELHLNEAGYFDHVFVHITPAIKSIDFRVKGVLIKSVGRVDGQPKIIFFGKEAGKQVVNGRSEDGYFIKWKIENKDKRPIGFTVQQRSGSTPSGWNTPFIGSSSEGIKDSDSIFVNPKEIFTSEKSIDYRAVITDGFHLQIWYEKGLVDVPSKRELQLFLQTGFERKGGWVVGQNTSIGVDFFDPETGEGCSANGCRNGNYEVTLTSNLQEVCPHTKYNAFDYYFEVPGTHIVTVSVRNKHNPDIHGQVSVKAVVTQDSYPPPSHKPVCEG